MTSARRGEQFEIVGSPPDEVVVYVTGDVDLEAEHAFAWALTQAAVLSPTGIVVDVSRMTFLGSTGLNVIVRAQLAMGEGARLRVRGAGRLVRRLFTITGLSNYLDDEETDEDKSDSA